MGKKNYSANILGLVLLPLCISTTVAFGQEVIKKSWTTNLTYIFLGGATYLFIHLLFYKPIVTYVTGHELTHALWGVLFGAKIKKMNVSRGGGKVAMTKTNFLVKLAPYVFPIYTALVMLIYFIINLFWPREWLAGVTIFLIGVTFTFHLVLSLHVLRIRQSDLSSAGFLLSIVFIYLANIFVLTILFTIISRHISLGSFLLSSAKEAHVVYSRIGSFFVDLFETVRGHIKERNS